MRHEAPPLSGLKWQDMAWGIPFLSAPDNHMYFIDVNSNPSALDQGATCIGYEYISFNPLASGSGTYKVDHGIAYDLDRSTRRLSAELASNASYPLPGSLQRRLLLAGPQGEERDFSAGRQQHPGSRRHDSCRRGLRELDTR